ncbi:MAG: hypothetical protein AABX70_02045 [Nanoarchaeota archaeon]
MSYGYGQHQQSHLISTVVGIGLILVGILSLNVKLQFIDLPVDLSGDLFYIIVALLGILGGIIILLHQKQQRYY